MFCRYGVIFGNFILNIFFGGEESSSFNPFGTSSSPLSTFIRLFLGFIISHIIFSTFVNANVKPCTVKSIDLYFSGKGQSIVFV